MPRTNKPFIAFRIDHMGVILIRRKHQ